MNRVSVVFFVIFFAGCLGCGRQDAPLSLAESNAYLVGVPENGYPNYQERLMLVAINRTRADPNVQGQTKAACSTDYQSQKPLMLSTAGSRCSRFHCANCILNDGGLSHNSYCTLRSDIGDTFGSSCDGSSTCACEPGSEHFSCDSLGGHGSSPWARCGYFGYSADGEVGAAGYSDGWSAVWGWVSECAGQDGHRRILTAAHNQIGLGYFTAPTACWSTLYFGDTSGGGPSTYTLPAGVHYPEHGASVDFYLNVYDPGGEPEAINLVLDGRCLPMDLEIGTAGQGTYKIHADMGAGCHRYWFLARDSSGQRSSWPQQGAWGAGDCTDYQPQAPEADCETCNPGDKKPCGVGQCAGQKTCRDSGTWGQCDGPAPSLDEICDGLDNDCDGVLPTEEHDSDGDGIMPCAGDCDDGDPQVYPGATERCNGRDDDCDGSVPAQELDDDSDGVSQCQGDCDDDDSLINPEASESCNQKDDNCNGSIDEGCDCVDGEHRPCGPDDGNCAQGLQDCQNGKWGICHGGVGPQAEICNGRDDDCDSVLPDDEQDKDGDGQMPCSGDCDDNDQTIFDGAEEVCDGKDNNCDGRTDEDCIQAGSDSGVGSDGDLVLSGGCYCGSANSSRSVAWWFVFAFIFLVDRKKKKSDS